MVLLSTSDYDLGLAPADQAAKAAAELARDQGVAVYLRDPISDDVEVRP